ncbi:PREDICTED: trypsin-1-like [Rhagoletis zephyria]|uniref:trypsin-1-like n=1 Tax=Rhagoletis zephyria TaxID=28612 RepID=UPI00081129AA|nr:PREDICTED: trypsin-1-like [Rhagoletis zephyria]
MFHLRYRFVLTIALCTLSWTPGTSSFSSLLLGRIVGGTSARDIVDFPYIVSVRLFNKHFCGGSIINERTVITAAHCLKGISASYVRVHAGTKSRSSHEGVLVDASAVHYDPRFNMATMDYDIGLVRLASGLTFSSKIQPIALPTEGELVLDGDVALVAGWGFTTPQGSGSYLLRYARVPIVNQAVCNRQLNEYLTDRMICAGYAKGGIDACQMDSGGPLVVDEKLVGIVSWGLGCAQPNKPGVYTRVAELIPWVERTLAEKYADSIPRDEK